MRDFPGFSFLGLRFVDLINGLTGVVIVSGRFGRGQVALFL